MNDDDMLRLRFPTIYENGLIIALGQTIATIADNLTNILVLYSLVLCLAFMLQSEDIMQLRIGQLCLVEPNTGKANRFALLIV